MIRGMFLCAKFVFIFNIGSLAVVMGVTGNPAHAQRILETEELRIINRDGKVVGRFYSDRDHVFVVLGAGRRSPEITLHVTPEHSEISVQDSNNQVWLGAIDNRAQLSITNTNEQYLKESLRLLFARPDRSYARYYGALGNRPQVLSSGQAAARAPSDDGPVGGAQAPLTVAEEDALWRAIEHLERRVENLER